MKLLLMLTAVVEGLTGLSLLLAPSLTSSMLLGVEINESVGLVVGRVAGAAVLALAIACWQARDGERGSASTGVVAAMLFYNASVESILVYAGVRLEFQSPLIWPVIVIHNVLGIWCLLILWRTSRRPAVGTASPVAE